MTLQLKLIDHFKLSNHLSLNFACSYSEDNRFFIINDVGVYILGFINSVNNEQPRFLCSKHILRVTNYSPSSNVGIDVNNFFNHLPKEDVYEFVMKLEYTPYLNYSKPIDPVPVYAEWSPRGIGCGQNCFIAVLSNMYSLEVFMKILTETGETVYQLIANISQSITEVEKLNWSDASRFGLVWKAEEYKKRVHIVTPTSFTWGHAFDNKGANATVIFVGHLNGDITIWRLTAEPYQIGKQFVPTFLGRCSTHLKRISTMQWHQSSEFGGGLFFSDIEGKLSVIHITKLNEPNAVFAEEQPFLEETDKIKIDKISIMLYNNHTFIIIVKQRVLIIFGINKKGEIFDSVTVYIEEYYVTGLYLENNKIIVLSLPGVLTELKINVINNQITIEKSIISLKYDVLKYRTHGFFFSKNRVLLGILAYPWDLKSLGCSKDKHLSVLVYCDVSRNPLEILWKNVTGSIKDYWDCVEVLRIVSLKEKRFPWLGLPDLNYDTLSITKLKTLRWLAKLSEMVFKKIPIVKTYDMKPYILIHYLLQIKIVTERMERLLKQRSAGELTTFQMRSLFLQNIFLKEMVAKNILPKVNVGQNFIDSIRSVMEIANELEYPEPLICCWCGDKVLGPTCFPPHTDSRCCISLMPIMVVPDYKCPQCKSLAHREVEKEMFPIVCPYCDINMDKLYLCENKLRENCENFQKEIGTLKFSDCFEDCLQESAEYDEIDENPVEYVIFSDSDDEPETIKKLYEEFSKAQINETKSEHDEVGDEL